MWIFGIDVNNYFDSTTAYCVDRMWSPVWEDMGDAIVEETAGAIRVYFTARPGSGGESFGDQVGRAHLPPGRFYDLVVVVGEGGPGILI